MSLQQEILYFYLLSISGSRLNLNQILYMLEVPFIQSTVCSTFEVVTVLR